MTYLFELRDFFVNTGSEQIPLTMRVSNPEKRSENKFGSRVEVYGLKKELNQQVYGVDAAQAVQLALRVANDFVTSSTEFRAGMLTDINGGRTIQFIVVEEVMVAPGGQEIEWFA